MSLDEKLTRIRELLTQRDGIDRELESIIGNNGGGPAKPAMPDKEQSRAVTPKTRKTKTPSKQPKKVGTRKCSNCGQPGHIARHCPNAPISMQSNEPTDAGTENVRGSERVKEMLRSGHDDEFIANECGVKIRSVAFIRRQMIGRGELRG